MDNGLVRPTPSIRRALNQTRAALEAAGHRVIEWTPYSVAQSMPILGAFFSGDGGQTLASIFEESGEEWPRGLKYVQAMYEKNKNNQTLVADLWKINEKKNDYTKTAMDHWEASKDLTGTGRPFDGVIAPTCPYPAPPR